MPFERKSIQGIRTMAALVDQRKTRTPAGALIELSALANERLLLDREVARATRRGIEIERRLKEIAAKEDRLMKLVHSPTPHELPAPESRSFTDETASPSMPAPRTLPVSTESSRFKLSEFTY